MEIKSTKLEDTTSDGADVRTDAPEPPPYYDVREARLLGAGKALDLAENARLVDIDMRLLGDVYEFSREDFQSRAMIAQAREDQTLAFRSKAPPGWFPAEHTSQNLSLTAFTPSLDRMISLGLFLVFCVLMIVLVTLTQ